MADFDFTPLLAQVPSDVLLEEVRRRMGLAGSSGDTGSSATPTPMTSAGTRDSFTPGQIRSDEFFRLSNPEAIRKFLAIMKRPQSPRAIVEGLKAGGVLSNAKNFYANIWTELKRARERGEVVNTPSGWGLAEWYPNKPKQVEPPKAKKRKKRAKSVHAPSAAPSMATAKAGEPVKSMTYQQFVSDRAKAGKNLKEIGAEWRVRKGG